MNRERAEGYFITDEQLLAALDDSDYEFDDLDTDPTFEPQNVNQPSTDSDETDDADELVEGKQGIDYQEPPFMLEREDEASDLNLDKSSAGPSSRQPALQGSSGGRGLRGNRGRGRGGTRGRGVGRGRGGERGGGDGQGRGQQRGRGTGGRGGGRTPRQTVRWERQALKQDFPPFQPQVDERCDRNNWNPLDYFNEYFDDNVFDLMVEQTNIYYHLKTGRELRVTKEEIKKFIGISMLMSTLGYPRIRLDWDQAFKIPLISKAMARDRYFSIRAAIHVVNDADVTAESKAKDRLWKVRPIIDKFRETVLKMPRQEDASIDEQIIPFTGHVGIRQFVPRKPNPTG